MNSGMPETLMEAITYFADADNAHSFMVAIGWPEGPQCFFCGSYETRLLSTRKIFRCKAKGCRKDFTAKRGTIFEDSPISLGKWFTAVWLIANCKNGISSYELGRDIGVCQKTAWFMLHRIRLAMKYNSFETRKLSGIVEADECHIGGLLKNMHKSKREKLQRETMEEREAKAEGHRQLGKKRRVRTGTGGHMGKTLVQAVVERDGEVRAQILQGFGTLERLDFIMDNVEKGSHVMTDTGNAKLGPEFVHEFINHQIEYVRGNVHTNSVENFWALLQRGLSGTYVSVEPYHLSAYVDEQAFRFNQRKDNDSGRFIKTLSQVTGRRLTYADLTRQPQPS